MQTDVTREAVARIVARHVYGPAGDSGVEAYWQASLPCADAILALLADRAGSGGVAAIEAERHRQVEQEGWTPEHDDEHRGGEMAAAAAAYAFSAATADRYYAADPVGFWPWDMTWWKPRTPVEDLVRAGALIAAEIDRIERVTAKALESGAR